MLRSIACVRRRVGACLVDRAARGESESPPLGVGHQEGPTNVLLDGTRYEYDTILKRTVEITPSG